VLYTPERLVADAALVPEPHDGGALRKDQLAREAPVIGGACLVMLVSPVCLPRSFFVEARREAFPPVAVHRTQPVGGVLRSSP
jgi:hypothetical protein